MYVRTTYIIRIIYIIHVCICTMYVVLTSHPVHHIVRHTLYIEHCTSHTVCHIVGHTLYIRHCTHCVFCTSVLRFTSELCSYVDENIMVVATPSDGTVLLYRGEWVRTSGP